MRASPVYDIQPGIPAYYVATASREDERFDALLEWCLEEDMVESSSLDRASHRAFWVHPRDYEQAVAFALRAS